MKQLLALGFVLFALPLAAQQVVSVRSGEHSGYSRLVLGIDPTVDWNVVDSRGAATISFPKQSLSFATAHVYDRISTKRIAGLSATRSDAGSELQLKLECQCKVQSFAFNKNYIVIDVYDGPALAPLKSTETVPQWRPDSLPFVQPPSSPERFSAFVMAQAPMQPRILPDPPKKAAPTPAPQLVQPATADPVAAPPTTTAPDAPADTNVVNDMATMAGAAVADMNGAVNVEDDPAMLARIKAAQTQLLAQLTRAADQGLINFVPAPAPVAEVKPVVITPDPAPAPAPPVVDPKLMQQLSARTAYARGSEDALSKIVDQFAMPQCLDDASFSMKDWGGEANFSDQLASLRSRLLGEFDVPDAAIAEKIVHLYLRYGLGAEARLILNETGVELANAAVYRDMAALLEGEPGQVRGPVLQGAGCGGAHEMWYLATGLGNYQVLEPLTITDVFSAYPIEVRELIGPPLAQAFIKRGQVEAGHVVLEIVRRAESGVTTAQRMAEARVMEAQGDLTGAMKAYRALSLENGEATPKALVSYVRTLLASGQAVPDTLLVDLESAAFLNRKTTMSDALLLAEVKVRAVVKGADAALQQIEHLKADRPQLSDALKEITAGIFEKTNAKAMGDYPYAQMVLHYADTLDQGPSGDAARLKIAEEMTNIGLPESALDVLAPNLKRSTASARHIQAAAYVQLFQPEQALATLTGDDSLPAYKVKLSAYLQMEDFPAVVRLLNDPHAKDISVNDVALRAGDWAKIKEAGAVGTLASYMQGGSGATANNPSGDTLPPMTVPEAPSLKAARALLANNKKSMQTLNDVLSAGQ